MEKSRYTTYHKTRTPKRKRIVRLRGSFEDRGKYIRCQNCGFTVDTDRDLGDPEHSGNYYTATKVDSFNVWDGGDTTLSTLDEVDQVGTVMNTQMPTDTTTKYRTVYYPDISRGCPFCGCTNLL